VKRKVGTTLDESLYHRAKTSARRQGRSLNDLIAEALEKLLNRQAARASVVRETQGTYKVSAKALRTVLEEDPYDAG